MTILDDLQYIKNLDKKNCLSSIDLLPLQCETAWKQASNLVFPTEYKDFSSIVFCGMEVPHTEEG